MLTLIGSVGLSRYGGHVLATQAAGVPSGAVVDPATERGAIV